MSKNKERWLEAIWGTTVAWLVSFFGTDALLGLYDACQGRPTELWAWKLLFVLVFAFAAHNARSYQRICKNWQGTYKMCSESRDNWKRLAHNSAQTTDDVLDLLRKRDDAVDEYLKKYGSPPKDKPKLLS